MQNRTVWSRWLRQTVVLGFMPVALGACGISTQQEMQMGAQYANEINRQLPILSDATVHRAINILGDQIARYGKRGIDYTFYVVNAAEVNAFAVPGGYVYVNRGLVERTTNWAELAGVLAHEIGHIEERHGVEQMERVQAANLGVNLAYVLLGRTPGTVERAAVGAGGQIVFSKFSREAENEADEVAVPLLVAAQVNPNGLVTMFEKLLAEQRSSPGRVAQWFSTHPTTQERIDHTRQVIGRLAPAQRSGASSSGTYDQVRARLRQLPAAPRTTAAR